MEIVTRKAKQDGEREKMEMEMEMKRRCDDVVEMNVVKMMKVAGGRCGCVAARGLARSRPLWYLQR